jgi:hypothetical protein
MVTRGTFPSGRVSLPLHLRADELAEHNPHIRLNGFERSDIVSKSLK